MLKLDLHIGSENDPEWFFLNHGVPESSRFWIHGVLIGRIGDDVDLTAFPADGVLTESDGAIRQSLPVVSPIWIAFPAIVDWVSGETLALLVF